MADVHHPHDRLFRLVFSDASEAAGLLQGALPDTLSNSFDWTSLTLQDGTFIDTDLRQSQSDLLYRIRYVATGEPVSMYVLLEHQSSPDPWLRLRLLRYCCRIWEAERRGEPERLALRPIVPVVFYQGERTWNYSTEFADLFAEGVRWLSWVPRFAHALLDQTTLAPGSVSGGVKGRLVQLLMMAAFGRHEEEALELTARLLSLLPAGGGVDDARPFFAYLAGTQESEAMAGFQAALRRHGSQRGEELMTYAEELLAQGRAEGLIEGERRTTGRTTR